MAIIPLPWDRYIDKEVLVYRHLHNHRLSIKAQVRDEHGNLSWRVVGHITEALIADVEFHVSEGSRLRAIAEGQRNVHAWGKGILLGWRHGHIDAPIDLQYNYKEHNSFVERGSQHPIHQCQYLVVRDNKVWCSPDAIDNNGSVIVVPNKRGSKKPKQVNLLDLY